MKKFRALSLFAAILMALTLMSGVVAAMPRQVDGIPPQVAGDSLKIPVAAENELYIFHTNDTHGRLTGSVESSDSDAFSSAKLAGLVKGMKAAGHNVLLLDAGDAIHGKVSANSYTGYSVINIMNKMGYDAMATGNHEFDYGFDRMLKLSTYTKFPILNANLTTDDGEVVFEKYVIKEFNGRKVGIFGLSTPETTTKANPKFFEGYVFNDVVETAEKTVAALKAAGCDYIIALGHIGMDDESPVTSTEVAEKVSGIDLFIDGHSHTKLEKGERVNDTLIVSTGEYLQNVGMVKITFGENGGSTEEAILFSEKDNSFGSIPADQKTQKLLDAYTAFAKELSEKVVGHTDEVLQGARELVRTSQTNLGSLITDAMCWKTDADIAITNGGGIRATIEAGDITYNDILTVLPFGNWVVVKKMTGADVLKVLEESVANYPNAAGGFMHVSGIAFTFDPAKTAGARVVDVTVDGKAIDPAQVYTVATNNFLADGGDGSSLGLGSVYGEYGALDQVLLEYMDQFGCVYAPGERITPIK